MSYVYYPECAESIPAHICNACGDDIEHGRISGAAFVKTSYLATLIAAPTVKATWTTGITNGDIIVIPEVAGTSDGGAATYGPGYGRTKEKFVGLDFTINFRDPNYKLNAPFYNAIAASRQWAFAWVTENLGHITDDNVTVAPKAPVTDDLASEVVWEVEVKFSQPGHAVPFVMPEGIFGECFALDE